MATSGIPFSITAGLPFAKTIVVTLPSGRSWWTNSADFEVRSQIREGQAESTPLILSLSPYLSTVFDGTDTVTITLTMEGKDTRLVLKNGYYDVIMSDAGVADARASVLLRGSVRVQVLVTAAKDTP